MWMNQTIVKGLAGSPQEAVRILESHGAVQAFQQAQGFKALYLVEDTSEPGRVISVSVWDSEQNGKAFYGSDTYKRIFGSIAELLTEKPVYQYFNVLTHG